MRKEIVTIISGQPSVASRNNLLPLRQHECLLRTHTEIAFLSPSPRLPCSGCNVELSMLTSSIESDPPYHTCRVTFEATTLSPRISEVLGATFRLAACDQDSILYERSRQHTIPSTRKAKFSSRQDDFTTCISMDKVSSRN